MGSVESVVGKTMKLKGELEIDGGLKIEGQFEGKIIGKAHVFISEGGKALIDLEAEDVTIGGSVEGKLKVRGKIKLLSSGYLKGEVIAKKMEIVPGAYFSGKCTMLKGN